jgi:hypothetical protein
MTAQSAHDFLEERTDGFTKYPTASNQIQMLVEYSDLCFESYRHLLENSQAELREDSLMVLFLSYLVDGGYLYANDIVLHHEVSKFRNWLKERHKETI